LRAAIYAGLVAAVLASIPLRPAFLFALPIGGVIAVILYRRSAIGLEPSTRFGFKLGALTGLFAFVILLVLLAIGTLAPSGQNELRQTMLQTLKQVQERAADPQSRQMVDYLMTSQGMATIMIASFILLAIFFVLLSGIGGAAAASFFRRKD
jgi:hypothetical protein